ncbi:metalloregulator ArsR/SmtB family transcription factor [Mycobacterium sp. PS03-16]|uniref:ArsR/SmtB family transcription factor n=1 Tax=Mycobacterium sp. PS03-16 TaxID=2559611 RepID=UPI001073D061|nr:metalloregulator ArsR/SmtB family transcription factor [Mycobacterium sp. PS03-16]TFV59344.1 metalloregulator ArsR/SmtB family transcription factor [Mycobacterium sp. PS03-16]
MDEVFKALADASRRRLLDTLNVHDGQTLRELCAGLDMTRQSVSKHLAVLEAAGLVTTVRRGREKLHHLNADPIAALSDRWITQYAPTRGQPPVELAIATPSEPAPEPQAFCYTTYLRTTPERLWHALTEPSTSRRHLGHAVVSTWEKGAAYAWQEKMLEITDPEQIVLESDPYQRLAFRFHTFTPEVGGVYRGLGADEVARAAAEPRSRVSFDMAVVDEQVELTVVHDGFGPDSVVGPLIARMWPRKLANLKSGLEFGPA